jgi:hypothetical protein
MPAWHRGQRERNGRGRGRRALECRDQGTSGVILFTLVVERYELDRANAAHPKCCCALCIAGALLNGGQLELIVLS